MSDLFRHELDELLQLERRLLEEVLPDMRERASAVGVQAALDRHLLETETHVANLERIQALGGVASVGADEDLAILASILQTEAAEAAAYAFLVHVAEAAGAGEEWVRLLRTNMEQDSVAGEHAEAALVELLAERAESGDA